MEEIKDLICLLEATGMSWGEAFATAWNQQCWDWFRFRWVWWDKLGGEMDGPELTQLMTDLYKVGGEVLARRTWESLPSSYLVNGNLFMCGRRPVATPWLNSLPPGLWVKGAMSLYRCESLTMVRDDLRISKNFLIQECPSLGGFNESFEARRNLTIVNCKSFEFLPSKLIVHGALNICFCPKLNRLPEDMDLWGGLHLQGLDRLSNLPHRNTRYNALAIYGCDALRSLPEGLTVRGDLTLASCRNLKALPSAISVGGIARFIRWSGHWTLPLISSFHGGVSLETSDGSTFHLLPGTFDGTGLRAIA